MFSVARRMLKRSWWMMYAEIEDARHRGGKQRLLAEEDAPDSPGDPVGHQPSRPKRTTRHD
ncbi:uncharacterized protein B0I36DRAFT_317092 [Microdochium trichocladiopsis]|uniref:Uncharacterized protein n=1 Tax=Microdochium trichocladiopsis TaxID=1682393 RepID=A0A9P8YBE3_9PEZI|nr:uncharacterized protein B0I36DRAFT_317092 [Microdochium trichocladiopsis]KAH7034855.1 hypothetical protein B0I36DRAFT_317092 [Microdochium trichocladiopsis]